MQRKNIIYLAVVVIVTLVAVLLLQRQQGGHQPAPGEVFLPGFSDQANLINRIELDLGGKLRLAGLTRKNGVWESDEPPGYQADWNKIRQLIASLAQAQVIELKTANPDHYARLGLGDISLPESMGVNVTLLTDEQSWSVLLGNLASTRQGQYARKAGQASSVLLDQQFELPLDTLSWLRQEVLNLPVSDIQSVLIQHPEAATVRLARDDSDAEDYHLEAVPEGRQIKSAWAVNGVPAALLGLTLDNVMQDDQIDFSNPVKTLVTTFDGRVITLHLTMVEETGWLRIAAETATPAERANLSPESEVAPGSDPLEWVQQFNARVTGWAFAIPAHKYATLTHVLEDFLDSPEGSSED